MVRLLMSFQTLLIHIVKLSLKTIELTHILQSDVDHAPELEDVMRRFKAWSEDCILVAHNAAFDMGHLAAYI